MYKLFNSLSILYHKQIEFTQKDYESELDFQRNLNFKIINIKFVFVIHVVA